MTELLIMGELVVEVMRDREEVPLYTEGMFRGPFPSGAPAICADAAARLGCHTALIGGVGDDDFGKCLLDRLSKDNVDISHVIVNNKKTTGTTFVTYFRDGSRKYLFHMGDTAAVTAKAPAENEFSDVKYMHIMGCSLMANPKFAQEILKTMHQVMNHGAKISFDPNIRLELVHDSSVKDLLQEVIRNASIFLPGREELLMFTGETNIEDAAKKCFENPKLEILVMKNGSRGSRIYTRNGVKEIGIYKVKQLDATGAGDCFDGAFLTGLIKGMDPVDAARWGAAAGALDAAAFGPMEGAISIENIEKMIRSN